MLSKLEKLWLLSQNLRITIGPWRTGYEALESWRCASDYYHLSFSFSYRSICYESIVYIQEHAWYMIWIHMMCHMSHISWNLDLQELKDTKVDDAQVNGDQYSIHNVSKGSDCHCSHLRSNCIWNDGSSTRISWWAGVSKYVLLLAKRDRTRSGDLKNEIKSSGPQKWVKIRNVPSFGHTSLKSSY